MTLIVSPHTGQPVESDEARDARLTRENVEEQLLKTRALLLACFGFLLGLHPNPGGSWKSQDEADAYANTLCQAIVPLVGREALKKRWGVDVKETRAE